MPRRIRDANFGVSKFENLDCPEQFSLLNFEERDYTNDRGQTYPMYEMTKDGFSFLVMGYTGSKAANFKVDFINEPFLSDDCRNAECQHIKKPMAKSRQW